MRLLPVKAVAIASICCCLVAGANAVCTGPQDLEARLHLHADKQAYVSLGTWFGKQQQYDCAIEAFHSALKFNPSSADLQYLLGLSLYSADHLNESIPPLRESIRLNSNLIKAHYVLATVFTQLDRNQEAEAEWRAALTIDPHSLIALDGLSQALIAQQEYASAIDLLRSGPRNETLTLDLAAAYGKAGKLNDAAQIVTRALRANPSSVRLMNALATVLVQQTRYQDAAQVAERAVRLHPHDMEAQRLYLRVLVLNHDSAAALPLGRKLLAAAPHDFNLLYLNGILEREAGEYPTARDHLTEAARLDPGNEDCHYNLGLVLSQLKDPQGAKEQFEKALELGAVEPQVRFELAAVLKSLGETQEAQQQLERYQSEMQASVRQTLATGKAAQAAEELANGNAGKAVDLYREAAEAAPNDALLLYKMALALDKKGDTSGERTTLEQAVKLDPTLALAQNQLGYLASREGDAASAEAHFRLAVAAAPGYTEAWVSLAATLGMESRFSEAQQAVSAALKIDPHNEQALHLREELIASQGAH